jgi:sterol desaturase/sphingolipid hydroxylase (fatty acid hydroxylase superfamily)
MTQFMHLIYGQAFVMACLMIGFTGLAFLSRGRAALQWSPELRQSAMTNVLLHNFGSLSGPMALLTIAPLHALYDRLSLPKLSPDAFDTWPLALTALLALLVYDFSMYWVHRALHMRWLWPSHAVHHSDPELNFLSWWRGHFTEHLVIAGALVFTLSWLGFAIEAIYGLAICKAVHQYYVHARLDWDHGPFKYVLVSPQFHRWHHARADAAHDKNFATIFPFFDVAFGTYYNPRSAIDEPTGIADEPSNDFVTQILYPFREWSRMLRATPDAAEASPIQT